MRLALSILLVPAISAFVGAQDESAEAELRVLRAWFALEDPTTRARAVEAFRAVAEDAEVDEALRIRAEIGWARADELGGERAAARVRLEKLIPRAAKLPQLRRVLVQRLGPPKWYAAVRVIPLAPSAWFLDLDTGGMTNTREASPRGGPEMEGANFLVATEADDEIATALPLMSSKPWHRLRTDEGNLCVVQVLSHTPQTVVRFVTRIGGFGEILPAPRRPFCIGYNSKIEVWWRTDKSYARYKVQRRVGPAAAWEPAVERDGPPFIDRKVDAGERYGYQIVGVTAEGYEGLPVRLQGTVRSRGVVTGRIQVQGGRNVSYDLLLGDAVSSGWDINVQNVWQQGAMIRSHYGSNLFALTQAKNNAEPLSPWDVTVSNQWQLKSGDRFLVPLNGGGVARCKITINKHPKTNRWNADIDYEVYGDADAFPEPPRVTARETAEGVVVHADVDAPYRLAEVQVRELVSNRGPWVLEIDEDGNALDTHELDGIAASEGAAKGGLREYSVVAMDAHGRRTLPGRALMVRMPDKPLPGEFKIRFQQGYSFARRKIVPHAEADIFFQTANTGIDRICFMAPKGIMNMRTAFDWNSNKVAEEQIFNRVAGMESADTNLSVTQIWINKGNRGENVLVLRTRHGGWVKMYVAARQTSGNWTQRTATVKFVYNPRAPRFDEVPGELTTRGGVKFSGLKDIEKRAKIVADWKSTWDALWRDGSFRRDMENIRPAGGDVADADDVQEVLLEEVAHKNIATARYSFQHGRRDAKGGGIPATAWDVKWSARHFHVRLSKGDNSTITDLGRTYWTRLVRPSQVVPGGGRSAQVRVGHTYLVRKVTGSAFGAPTLMRVRGLEPWNRLQIEWVSLQDGKLRLSPGLTLDAETQERIRAMLEKLPKDDAATTAARGGEKARRAYSKLLSEQIGSVARRDAKLAEFIDEFATVVGLKFVLEGDVGTRKVSVLRNRVNAFTLLLDVADAADLEWRIDPEGRIHLRPRVLTEEEKKEGEAAAARQRERAEAEKKRRLEELRKEKLAELKDIREALKRAIDELEQRKKGTGE
ncbi:MAG: hypothetical protein ACYTGZ_19820 [Planctomycetota bacterium]|jgi:hypothetical protein